jgi:hypothetical protein
MGDTRPDTRIARKKLVHAAALTGENYDQVLALGFHHLQQDLDRFLPVVALVVRPVQVVGLLDEQDAAHGLLQDFFGFGRRMTDVLPDKLVACDGHDLAAAYESKPVQDASGKADRSATQTSQRCAAPVPHLIMRWRL